VTRCPECGISFEEFRAKGRLGCPKDYEVFAKDLGPLLEKIHGSRQHVGRVPRGAGPDTSREDRLLRLRRDLARAVKDEQYEEAARLRTRSGSPRRPSVDLSDFETRAGECCGHGARARRRHVVADPLARNVAGFRSRRARPTTRRPRSSPA
jgi:hypothetical protein